MRAFAAVKASAGKVKANKKQWEDTQRQAKNTT
jgi:hypothetical protein